MKGLRGAAHSLTVRLALLLAVVFAVALTGIGGLMYRYLDAEMRDRDTAELQGKMELVRRLAGQFASPQDLAGAHHLRDALVGHSRLHVALLAADGRLLFHWGERRAGELAGLGRAHIAGKRTGLHFAHGSMPFVAATEPVALGDAGHTRLWAVVAVETGENRQLLAAFLRSLLVTLVGGGLLAALAGLWAIRVGLAPIARIADIAERVSAARLDGRIPAGDTPPELARLVTGFNSMLERLGESFRRLSEFSSDLAHELRTPLHSLLGHAQLALSRPRQADEYRAALEEIVEEAERLSRMVRDMLFLAQADDPAATLSIEKIDLRAELDAVVSFYRILAEEKAVDIAVEGAGTVEADRGMVQRAVGNLLSNALRHTPAGSTVRAAIRLGSNDEICLEIGNPGRGLSQAAMERVFDRFYRADGSRSDKTGGTGLGLAIVHSIMKLHHGRVEVESTPEGPTLFRLAFPSRFDEARITQT